MRRLLDLQRYAAHGPLETGEMPGSKWLDLEAVLAARRTGPGRAEAGPQTSVGGRETRTANVDALGRNFSPASTSLALSAGERVRHARFGDGEVVQVKALGAQTEALIRFESGTKRITLEFARLEKLSS